jgi:hypothetical protein
MLNVSFAGRFAGLILNGHPDFNTAKLIRMKKIIAILITAIALVGTPFAQQATSNLAISSPNRLIKSSSLFNAERNFRQSYPNVTGGRWNSKADGYIVKFQAKAVKYEVAYDKKGRWQHTILIYNEDQLPSQLRRTVKSVYVDFTIVKVIEVTIGRRHTYFIKMEDSNTLRTVQVVNGEFVELDSYVKG